MIVRIESLLEGAERAAGTVVVIDVFRAFTTACLAFRQGAERIVLFAGVAEAAAFAAEHRGSVLIGEVDGIKPDGFDFGNSPAEVEGVDFSGKTLVQSTRAGTTGVAHVPASAQVLAASLQNAAATAQWILRERPALVTLVAMGWEGRRRTDEDELCALYIRGLLEGGAYPTGAIRALILASKEARKFGDPASPQFAARDLDHCLDVDAADFAIRVAREAIDDRDVWVARPSQRLGS